MIFIHKKMVEALVNMVIKDSQPFTVVEDEGFKGFLIHALDPSYIIPIRQVSIAEVVFDVQSI